MIVSEAGASVYSASELAAREFPGLDVSLRGAVSIARRLQDPLAELVKLPPQSIGVGQHRHDVDQRRLSQTLEAVVEDAVNAVGVDLNMASAPLLAHVAGLGPSLASAIVAHRDAQGAFPSRRALLKAPGLGPKAFEQCAGFLRIRDGGEEILVVEGVFQDEHGDYPAGACFRNPPGPSHGPAARDGCAIFVRLWRFRAGDAGQIVRQPGAGDPAPLRAGAAAARRARNSPACSAPKRRIRRRRC